jgi:hypothetical protein
MAGLEYGPKRFKKVKHNRRRMPFSREVKGKLSKACSGLIGEVKGKLSKACSGLIGMERVFKLADRVHGGVCEL